MLKQLITIAKEIKDEPLDYPFSRGQKLASYGSGLCLEAVACNEALIEHHFVTGIAVAIAGIGPCLLPKIGWSEYGATTMRPGLINKQKTGLDNRGKL